jgi:Icc-related predicted phosphoesterase
MRVAAVADLHVGSDSRGVYAPFMAKLADDADVLVVGGDLTQVGAIDEAKMLAEELAPADVPVVAVLGNHDHHSGFPDEVRAVLTDAGVTVLDGDVATVRVGDATLGVMGDTGFGGGFTGASGSAFGEQEMKQFMRRTECSAARIQTGLDALDTDVRLVLLHYAPVKDTVIGERAEIYPFLGSSLLAHAIDAAGADLVVHGHAHAGTEQGVTPGGVRVRNVALPLIRRPYRVFCLDE